MKTILLLLFMAASLFAEYTDEEFMRLQGESHKRAVTKYAVLFEDKGTGFLDYCEKEIVAAENTKDPIMLSPDWPEKIADRVMEKYFRRKVAETLSGVAVEPNASPAATQPLFPNLKFESEKLPTYNRVPIIKQFDPFVTLFTIFFAAFVGCVIPWIVFSEKDKKSTSGYTLGRLSFFGWMIATFVFAVVGSVIASMIGEGNPNAAHIGWGLSLAFVATRRLRDFGASPWFALFGLLWPISIFGHIALCFIPGWRRTPPPLPLTHNHR